MKSLVLLAAVFACGCAAQRAKKLQQEYALADSKSGPDGKRSGAQVLRPNKSRTDEVSFKGEDRTDWYVVSLRGRPGVLTTQIHWDNEMSDIMIDVFDEFGAQIAASPVRGKGDKEKRLLTQIDKVGTYYIRVTAPGHNDGSVYTVEAQWDEPREIPVAPVIDEPPPERPERRRRPVVEKPVVEKPSGETIQGRVVAVYREGAGLTMQLDKGSAQGVRVGQSGTVLMGPSGEDPLDGGSFRVTQVIDENKSIGKTQLRSVGKNTRVMITLGR